MPGGLRVRRLAAPLAARDFRLLWFGQTVSLAGNGIFAVALTWAVLQTGRGPSALALVLLANAVPTSAFLLVGGVVSDRLPRRTTMLGCDLVQAAVIGAVAAVSTLGRLHVWHLVVAAGCGGVASGFFLPASTGLVPEVAPPDGLVPANSLLALSRLTAGRLAGPVVGGFLVAVSGSALAFGVDAATFLVSAGCLALIRHRSTAGSRQRSRLRTELREGLGYCLRRRWLWVSLLAFAVLNIGVSAPLAALIPVYVKEHLRLDARSLGLLFAVQGASAAVSTVVAGNLRAPRRPVLATHVVFAASGLALATLALTSRLLLVGVALCVVSFLLEVGNVYWASGLQAAVPNRLLGRVSSVDWLVSGSLLPAGIAAVGPAAAAFGVGPVFLAGGVVTALGGAAAATAIRRHLPC
jgi:MFS family permease